MTTLPLPIPEGYTLVVKKGDSVSQGDPLATSNQPSFSEHSLDLVGIYNESAGRVRKYVKKGPGDKVMEGDVLASRPGLLGLKIDCVIAHISGTVLRFERDTGTMVIQGDQKKEVVKDAIFSPLAGTITVCNNDAIVITPLHATEKSSEEERAKKPADAIVKAVDMGVGGEASGELLVVTPEDKSEYITSSDITKKTIGKILLLPNIDKEAVVKAAAIGVAGILGTQLPQELFAYVEKKKIDLPLVSIDEVLGKKLIKAKQTITMNGKDKTVRYEN